MKESPGLIPKTGGQRYRQQERERFVKEEFGKKYGYEISKRDYLEVLRDLKSSLRLVRNPREKRKIDRKLNFLKELGGIDKL